MKPRVEIRYCTQCRWLLRAAWLAQELLAKELKQAVRDVVAPGGFRQCASTTPAPGRSTATTL